LTLSLFCSCFTAVIDFHCTSSSHVAIDLVYLSHLVLTSTAAKGKERP
jgi:hypothetical protein